jgi:predicted aldo/keto reductase-like oxidoreductase
MMSSKCAQMPKEFHYKPKVKFESTEAIEIRNSRHAYIRITVLCHLQKCTYCITCNEEINIPSINRLARLKLHKGSFNRINFKSEANILQLIHYQRTLCRCNLFLRLSGVDVMVTIFGEKISVFS